MSLTLKSGNDTMQPRRMWRSVSIAPRRYSSVYRLYTDRYDGDSEYSYTGANKFINTMYSYHRIYAHCLQSAGRGIYASNF